MKLSKVLNINQKIDLMKVSTSFAIMALLSSPKVYSEDQLKINENIKLIELCHKDKDAADEEDAFVVNSPACIEAFNYSQKILDDLVRSEIFREENLISSSSSLWSLTVFAKKSENSELIQKAKNAIKIFYSKINNNDLKFQSELAEFYLEENLNNESLVKFYTEITKYFKITPITKIQSFEEKDYLEALSAGKFYSVHLRENSNKFSNLLESTQIDENFKEVINWVVSKYIFLKLHNLQNINENIKIDLLQLIESFDGDYFPKDSFYKATIEYFAKSQNKDFDLLKRTMHLNPSTPPFHFLNILMESFSKSQPPRMNFKLSGNKQARDWSNLDVDEGIQNKYESQTSTTQCGGDIIAKLTYNFGTTSTPLNKSPYLEGDSHFSAYCQATKCRISTFNKEDQTAIMNANLAGKILLKRCGTLNNSCYPSIFVKNEGNILLRVKQSYEKENSRVNVIDKSLQNGEMITLNRFEGDIEIFVNQSLQCKQVGNGSQENKYNLKFKIYGPPVDLQNSSTNLTPRERYAYSLLSKKFDYYAIGEKLTGYFTNRLEDKFDTFERRYELYRRLVIMQILRKNPHLGFSKMEIDSLGFGLRLITTFLKEKAEYYINKEIELIVNDLKSIISQKNEILSKMKAILAEDNLVRTKLAEVEKNSFISIYQIIKNEISEQHKSEIQKIINDFQNASENDQYFILLKSIKLLKEKEKELKSNLYKHSVESSLITPIQTSDIVVRASGPDELEPKDSFPVPVKEIALKKFLDLKRINKL